MAIRKCPRGSSDYLEQSCYGRQKYSFSHQASTNLHNMAPQFLQQCFLCLPVSLHSFRFSRTGVETAHLAVVPPSDWWCLVRRGYQHWQRGLEACRLPRFSHTVQNGGMEYSGRPCISVLGPSQSNTGEAATEPERTQEHSLSNFAGGQHFFEYLLVVSLKKKRSGDDYEPTITYQFPKVRTEERWGLRAEVGKQRVFKRW